jgi:alanine-glyoxylate transaminase/(R)-3-amino-2-methylpropionate-pyruvate transaminase
MGLMLGVELVRDRKTKEPATAEAARVLELCKDRGLLIGKGGLYGNTLRISPPMIVNKDQIDDALRLLGEALAEATK